MKFSVHGSQFRVGSGSTDNWLKARTVALGRRSVSDTLDGLVSEARGRERGLTAARSVAGTVRIAEGDPDLATADAAVRELLLADERRPNADPFDALICAAAASLGLPLITRNADLTASRIVRTWW